MASRPGFYVALLHHPMVDKQGTTVITSLTPIDLHDLARSCKTYGVNNFFCAHPSPSMRKLAHVLLDHWQEGFGGQYNPNRKEALDAARIVSDIDEAIMQIELAEKKLPRLIATSAKQGTDRLSFRELRTQLAVGESPHLLMLGTGWGMAPELLARADIFLEPINGPTEYNHLSVRAACAIMLDRLLADRD